MNKKKVIYWVLGIILSPFVVIILLGIALYLPPVQNWAVHTASRYASEELGMNVSVEHVHLAFPLDLSIEGVRVTQQNDSLPQVTDTIADVGRAVVDVRLLPLFHSQVSINAVELQRAKLNTADFIHEARVKGYVGELKIEKGRSKGTPVAGVKLDDSWVTLGKIVMDDAHLDVALSDTVPEDTTKSENKWKIHVEDLAITKSDLCLHMPGDTLQVLAQLGEVKAHNGYFDLGTKLYKVASFAVTQSVVQYDNNLLKQHFAQEVKSFSGNVAVDTSQVRFNGTLQTPASILATRLTMDFNAFNDADADADADLKPGKIQAYVDASIGREDIMAVAQIVGKKGMLGALPMHPLTIKGEVEGNMQEVHIPCLTVEMPTVFSLDAKGEAKGFMSLTKNMFSRDFAANLHADLKTYNLNFVKTFLDRNTAKKINIPSVHALADVAIHGADYDVSLRATQGRGSIRAKAKTNLAMMSYDADVKAQGLQLGNFVKGMHLGTFTGTLKAHGQGTNLRSPKTRASVKATVAHFAYGRYNLNNIRASATMKKGVASVNVTSHNPLVSGMVDLEALVDKKCFNGTIAMQLDTVDLYHLFVADMPMTFSLCTHVDISTDYKESHTVQGLVSDIIIRDTSRTYHPDDLVLNLLTRRDTTSLYAACGDFLVKAHSHGGYKWLMGCGNRLMAAAKKQFRERTIDESALRRALPRMDLEVHCSEQNSIYRLIKYYGIAYKNIEMKVRTSYENGIFADVWIDSLTTESFHVDTIKLNVGSKNNPYKIYYEGLVKNIRPSLYVFSMDFDGEVLEHGISLNTKLYDENNELSVKLGVEAEMVDSGIRMHLTPKEPVLAYTPFHMNTDNFLMLGRNGRVWADVKLDADDGTGIQLYSNNADADGNADADSTAAERLQDITLSVKHLNLERLLSAIPYMPKIRGMLYGDAHFMEESDGTFSLASDIAVRDMYYEGCKVGNIGTDIVYMPKTDGSHYIDGHITLEEKEIGGITGSYNFATDAIDATISLEQFPMSIANGFIPQQIIGFEGTAEGSLTIQGTTRLPEVNGEVFLQDASLLSVPYGVKLAFDNDPVTIKDSKLLFENFQMYDTRHNPLVARGSLDFSDTEHMKLDLRMKAEKFLIIDSKETRHSEAYGQTYVNFLCSMRGELDKLSVRGKLEVLPSTSLYYILRDTPLTTDNRMKELVTFTDFTSKDPVKVVKPTVDGLSVDMTVVVDNGAHIKAWLNDAHTNYLDIMGEGTLRMKMTGNDMFLTGRYTINEGEMKYSLPVIPLKTFTITDGSYIEFTGDMMNPKLNITAKEEMKASATIDNVNQIVTFKTGVRITKQVSNMGIEFLVEAPENQTIQEQLSMMSKEERGKVAVTLLTTGMFLSSGNTSGFSMNSALNAFLQSEISNIAGSALKTLDMSFGMDNSTESDGTMHTNYSFKFAKRFWNNRLAISVGGKISSGPDVSGQNKSFFDNVEVQYRFSDTSNQYMQLFYKHSVYDFLEGYVGQYGGGYMYKRRMQYLRELFHPSYGKTVTPLMSQRKDTTVVKNNKVTTDTIQTK